MKKTFLIIIVLFSLLIVTSAQAQLPATNIETLILDIWPDYDKDSVLILLTGTLPQDTPLPATVTIPMPDDAQINAIARITSDNQMVDDLEYTTGNNMLTFTTPDPRFRMEYYAPYEIDGINHAFTFDWLADISVDGVLTAVQQPTNAANMIVIPGNANVVSDSADGFTYHTFSPQPIPAGEPFTLSFNYDMVIPQLSVESLPSVNPVAESNAANAAASNSSSDSFSLDNINWAVVVGLIGVVMLAVAITWQVATRNTQPTRKNRKPRPKRASSSTKSSGKAGFCHQCGKSLNSNDKFCKECGTAVKGF